MSIRSAAPPLAAALLSGASTPLAKPLVGDVPPVLLAGLLCLGSGLGLLLLIRRARAPGEQLRIPRNEMPWPTGAIVAAGVLSSWEPRGAGFSTGALLVIPACACWAIDNNIAREVSTNDAMLVACLKGLIARA